MPEDIRSLLERVASDAPDPMAFIESTSGHEHRRPPRFEQEPSVRTRIGVVLLSIAVASAGTFIAIRAFDGVGRGGPASTAPIPDRVPDSFAPGRIAFETAKGLFTMDPDGGLVSQISPSWAGRSQPAWSPDGELVAFSSSETDVPGGEIFRMNADGSDVRMLTSPDTDGYDAIEGNPGGSSDYLPLWSPDGTQVAFDRAAAGVLQIGLIHADGSEQRIVRSNSSELLAWTPDGLLEIADPELGVVLLDPVTGETTDFPIANEMGCRTDSYADGVQFSADGSIAVCWAHEPDGGLWTLAVMALGDRSTATYRLDVGRAGSTDAVGRPAIAPDGRAVVFESFDGDDDLYRLDLVGTSRGQVTALTDTPQNEGWPVWAVSIERGPTPSPTPAAGSGVPDCRASAVRAPFEGDATREGQVKVHCDDRGHWVMDVEWGSGAAGSWGLQADCAEACRPYATPDLNGDGRAELLLWSADDAHVFGYAMVFDMNPSEAAGVPVSITGTDVALDGKVPVGGDDQVVWALGCQAGGFTSTVSRHQPNGKWRVDTSILDFASSRTSTNPGLSLRRVQSLQQDQPVRPESNLCGVPVLLAGTGNPTAIVPAERLNGVAFQVCELTTTILRYGNDSIGAAVVFQKASGDTCGGSGTGAWYLGVSADQRGDPVAAYEALDGCRPACWAYSAFETFDRDGAWDVAVGIRPSTSTVRFYDVGPGPGAWAIAPIRQQCPSATACPTFAEFENHLSESGEGAGLSCRTQDGKIDSLVAWSAGPGGQGWQSVDLVFDEGIVHQTNLQGGSGNRPDFQSLETCLGAITSPPPS